MTTPRCWPGALCRIVKSLAGNEGRRVIVLRAAGFSETAGLDRRMRHADIFQWVVQPLQPITNVNTLIGATQVLMPLVFPDSWLEPIADPQGLDEMLRHAGFPAYAHG